MQACAAVSVGLCLFVSGCASTQLNYNTLDLATSVGHIQTQEVLYNLSVILDDPAAIPTHVDLSEGTASTINSIDPSISFPIAQIIAQATVAAGTANQLQNTLARTGVSTSVSAHNVSSQSLSGTQFPWLYRDGDPLPQNAVRLGHFGRHVLYISKAEKWKLSDFTLFVLTATTQSTATTNSSGSSGQSGKSGLAATASRGSVILGGQVLPLTWTVS